jgi:hypothetical protein
MLPKLLNEGYNCLIHCAEATADLSHVMLFDSVGIYLSDLRRDNRTRQANPYSLRFGYSVKSLLMSFD